MRRSAPYRKPQKIRLLLLAVISIASGFVLWVYIESRQDSKTPQQVPESIKKDTTMSIGKIQQTATRKGRKEWSLEASSGQYIDKTNQMLLKDLTVTFYLKDNSEVTLTADQGTLKTDSNDIEVSGNVVLRNNEYKLRTENLKYRHDRRVLYSRAPVIISGSSADLAADSISFDLNSRKLVLEGSVEATIAKDFAL